MKWRKCPQCETKYRNENDLYCSRCGIGLEEYEEIEKRAAGHTLLGKFKWWLADGGGTQLPGTLAVFRDIWISDPECASPCEDLIDGEDDTGLSAFGAQLKVELVDFANSTLDQVGWVCEFCDTAVFDGEIKQGEDVNDFWECEDCQESRFVPFDDAKKKKILDYWKGEHGI